MFDTPPIAVANVQHPNGNAYSVAFETKLANTSYPGISRARHFQEANKILLKSIRTSKELSTLMKNCGIHIQPTSTGLAPRVPPAGWTWHHASNPGIMQLVPRNQHAPGSAFWNTLHPNGQGGYAIWGKQ